MELHLKEWIVLFRLTLSGNKNLLKLACYKVLDQAIGREKFYPSFLIVLIN